MDFSVFTTISAELIVFVLFVLAFLIQCWFFLARFSKLAYYKKKDLPENTPAASIVICAKNEEKNLVEFLPKILAQDYPSFEVVVVNDCSADNTGDILKEFSLRYKNLKIVTIIEDEYYSHGKKVALMMGIKGASNEHLLLTDADCRPASNFWLHAMMQHFSKDVEIVLGYGAYEKRPGFLNKLIRFDTFQIALQFLSFTLVGKTYLGTGRNLAYKKSLFFKMKGFASHYHIESGDDDLFINEAATKNNTRAEIAMSSFTISRAKKTFKEWFQQKRRHVTTFSQYNFSGKLRLTFISGSQYLFYTAFVSCLCFKFLMIPVVCLFVIRLGIQLLIFNKSMKQLGEKDLLLLSPLIEPILLVIYPFIPLTNMTMKKNKWR